MNCIGSYIFHILSVVRQDPEEVLSVENQKPDPKLPVWRETPLDHWSREVDPAVMAGDEWSSNDPREDPGAQRMVERQGGTRMGERFMHPQHDTSYGLEEDTFTSEDKG